MSNNPDDKTQAPSAADPKAKKPYTKPELVVHGTVDRLTENSTASGSTYDFQQNIAQRSK